MAAVDVNPKPVEAARRAIRAEDADLGGRGGRRREAMAGQQLLWPDAQTVVMLLEPVVPTVTATSAELVVHVIRVQRVGGSDDGIIDRPRVEIACYGTDRV